MENFIFSVKHSSTALDSRITIFQINCLQNCLIKTINLLQKRKGKPYLKKILNVSKVLIIFKDTLSKWKNVSKMSTRCHSKKAEKQLSNSVALSIAFCRKFVKASDRTFFDLNTFASQLITKLHQQRSPPMHCLKKAANPARPDQACFFCLLTALVGYTKSAAEQYELPCCNL